MHLPILENLPIIGDFSLLHLSGLEKLEYGLHIYIVKQTVTLAALLLHHNSCQNRQNCIQIIITKYPPNVKNKEKDKIKMQD
jgi:hypothetical protein